jgi:hypothetical protein
MGKRRQGYVQGWTLGKDARDKKSLYGEISKRRDAQIANEIRNGVNSKC